MNLREIRKKHNVHQIDVAKQLGVSQNSYSYYEMGKRTPNIEVLSKLADIFNTSIDVLVDRRQPEDVIDMSLINETKKKLITRILMLEQDKIESLNDFLTTMMK